MSAEKKKYIFDIAVRLFSERGYDAVTIRELSGASGVNDATLYYYFKSKEGILKEIITEFKICLKRFLVTEKQIDKFIETDTPHKLLSRLIPIFRGEDSVFMSRAYRIVCMEQFKYQIAGDVFMKQIYGGTARVFKYALDKLIEHGDLPALDTQMLSVVWAGAMFSRAVTCMSVFPEREAGYFKPDDFTSLGEFLVNLAVNETTHSR